MKAMLIASVVLLVMLSSSTAFSMRKGLQMKSSSTSLAMTGNLDGMMRHVNDMLVLRSSMSLADTSISEEEVLDTVGRVNDLPNPLYALGFAAVVFLGVAILQFSLGDLTKEVQYNVMHTVDCHPIRNESSYPHCLIGRAS